MKQQYRRLLVLGVILVSSLSAEATEQVRDTIFYDGRTGSILPSSEIGFPLEGYNRSNPVLKKAMWPDGFRPVSSALWRGYVASWEVADGKLYLTGIVMGHRQDAPVVDLKKAFPKRAKEGRVFADWVTGRSTISRKENRVGDTPENHVQLGFINGKLADPIDAKIAWDKKQYPELCKNIPYFAEKLNSDYWQVPYMLISKLHDRLASRERLISMVDLSRHKNPKVAHYAQLWLLSHPFGRPGIRQAVPVLLHTYDTDPKGTFYQFAHSGRDEILAYFAGDRPAISAKLKDGKMKTIPQLDPAKKDDAELGGPVELIGLYSPEQGDNKKWIKKLKPYVQSTNPYILLRLAKAFRRLGDKQQAENILEIVARQPFRQGYASYNRQALKRMKQTLHPNFRAALAWNIEELHKAEGMGPYDYQILELSPPLFTPAVYRKLKRGLPAALSNARKQPEQKLLQDSIPWFALKVTSDHWQVRRMLLDEIRDWPISQQQPTLGVLGQDKDTRVSAEAITRLWNHGLPLPVKVKLESVLPYYSSRNPKAIGKLSAKNNDEIVQYFLGKSPPISGHFFLGGGPTPIPQLGSALLEKELNARPAELEMWTRMTAQAIKAIGIYGKKDDPETIKALLPFAKSKDRHILGNLARALWRLGAKEQSWAVLESSLDISLKHNYRISRQHLLAMLVITNHPNRLAILKKEAARIAANPKVAPASFQMLEIYARAKNDPSVYRKTDTTRE